MIPYATIFGPNNHIAGESLPFPGIDQDNVTYYNGEDPAVCPATSFTGSEYQWYYGALTTDPIPSYNPYTNCPESCDCAGIGPQCPYVTFARLKVARVTIAGATGAFTDMNGVWDLENAYPAGGVCVWRTDPTSAFTVFTCQVSDDGFGDIGIFININHRTPSNLGEFDVIGLAATDGVITIPKTGGFIFWPATITVEFVAM